MFLQLPQTDNDTSGPSENVMLASAYLRHSTRENGEYRFFRFASLPRKAENTDNRNLIKTILSQKPDIICATLYLWNIERSLRVLNRVKSAMPYCRVVAGGPEVAYRHPFLFKNQIIDIAVVGEGETVFPLILKAIRTGRQTDFKNVAWRKGEKFIWGSKSPPALSLSKLLPPASSPLIFPDKNGMAYMETSRGCPMRCAFCCYNQRRRDVSWLSAQETALRVKTMIRKGVSEIRFIDPTFNSNPNFTDILQKLASINSSRKIKFFAELRADTITAKQAELLAKANFTEIEIGIQSINPKVLRVIQRPMKTDVLFKGIHLLSRKGIRLTLDVMCGLPGQTLQDVRATLQWAKKQPNSRIQFLHTLLLPGTPLRDHSRRFGLKSQNRPPYRVLRTQTMLENDMLKAETLAEKITGYKLDNPTRRFIGSTLPDLFNERVTIDLDSLPASLPGIQNRRAIMIKGNDFFAATSKITRIISTALKTEPDVLWQFVLCPAREEPLNVLDAMINVLKKAPLHINDRLSVRSGNGILAARRIMVKLSRHSRYSTSWIHAVETLLSSNFY